jgi:hypothetical protein
MIYSAQELISRMKERRKDSNIVKIKKPFTNIESSGKLLNYKPRKGIKFDPLFFYKAFTFHNK